ncbi:hypothetical protein SK128_028042, partial [Halocaridina rubra]
MDAGIGRGRGRGRGTNGNDVGERGDLRRPHAAGPLGEVMTPLSTQQQQSTPGAPVSVLSQETIAATT